MTQILERFAIALGLTGADQAKEDVDDVSASMDEAEGSARAMDVAVGVLSADLTGKLVDGAIEAAKALATMVPEFAAAGDELGKTSDALAINTDELQRLRFAAQRSGVEVSQVEDSVGILRKAMFEASQGSGPLIGAFEKLGLEVEAVAKLPIEDQLGVIGDALNELDSDAEAAAITMTIFGDGNKRMGDLLAEGSKGIKGLGDELEDLGGIMSAETIDATEALSDDLFNLDTAIGGISTRLLSQLMPSFAAGTQAITDWVAANDEMIQQGVDVALNLILGAAEALEPVLIEVVNVLWVLVPLIDDVIDVVLPVVKVLGELAASVLKKVNPSLERLIAALGPVIDLLGDVLVDAIEQLEGPVDNITSSFVFWADQLSFFLETGNAVIEWIDQMLDRLEKKWPRAFAIAREVVEAITSPLDTVRNTVESIFDWIERAVPQVGEIRDLIQRIRASLGLGEEALTIKGDEQPAAQFPGVIVPTAAPRPRPKPKPDETGAEKRGRRGRGGGGGGRGGRGAAEPTADELIASLVGGVPVGDPAGGGAGPGPSIVRIDASFNAPTTVEVNVFGVNLGDPDSVAEVKRQIAGELSGDIGEMHRRAFERYKRVLV